MDNSKSDTYDNIIRNFDENRLFREKQHNQSMFFLKWIKQISDLAKDHDNSKHCQCNLAKDIRKKDISSWAEYDEIFG